MFWTQVTSTSNPACSAAVSNSPFSRPCQRNSPVRITSCLFNARASGAGVLLSNRIFKRRPLVAPVTPLRTLTPGGPDLREPQETTREIHRSLIPVQRAQTASEQELWCPQSTTFPQACGDCDPQRCRRPSSCLQCIAPTAGHLLYCDASSLARRIRVFRAASGTIFQLPSAATGRRLFSV